MKLLGYHTGCREADFKSKNPNTAYINLSRVNKWVKTIVVHNGSIIQIPHWLLRDHLSIEQVLTPNRSLQRQNTDRLTVEDALIAELQGHGYRYGSGTTTLLPEPDGNDDAVSKLKYADQIRQQLADGTITYLDVMKKIMVTYFKAKQQYSDYKQAKQLCKSVYGWSEPEFMMAYWWYHGCKQNEWLAPGDDDNA